jgi:SAM-dependent methyltransferase
VLFNKTPTSPILDIGCALGRTTFELAERSSGLCLGIDISFPMLRLAQQVLRHGRLSFPLKQLGIVYRPVEIETRFKDVENVDFWLCNALSLPFKNENFTFVNALNVVDVSGAPRELLKSIGSSLNAQGQALLATPYDWATGVPMEKWLGGHAQHLAHEGNSEDLMREILTPQKPYAVGNLRLIAEKTSYPWHVRVHARRTAAYDTHILACEKVNGYTAQG